MRDWIFAILLAVAALFVVAGVAQWSTGAALCASGLLLAGWAWLTFVYGEAGDS